MIQDIQNRIRTVMSDLLHCQESDIRLEASLRDDLQMDSLKLMTLMILLEDEFQQTIPPEEASGLHTVNDVIEFVAQRITQSPPS